MICIVWIFCHAFKQRVYVGKPLDKPLTAWLVDSKAHFCFAFFSIALANSITPSAVFAGRFIQTSFIS